MKDDTVVALRQPESFSDDPLTEILRAGARQLLGQAIEAEVAAHIEAVPSIYCIGPPNDGSVFRNGHQIDLGGC